MSFDTLRLSASFRRRHWGRRRWWRRRTLWGRTCSIRRQHHIIITKEIWSKMKMLPNDSILTDTIVALRSHCDECAYRNIDFTKYRNECAYQNNIMRHKTRDTVAWNVWCRREIRYCFPFLQAESLRDHLSWIGIRIGIRDTSILRLWIRFQLSG